MKLFYIYDTSSGDPDEDPSKSIMYCYPFQEIDTDICMLFCQIVGISRFIKLNFSNASAITLDNGTFVLCQTENYLLVLGGNQDESTELLKMQMKLICKAFVFSYFSLKYIFHLSNEDHYIFKKKLREIWTPFLSSLQRCQNVMKIYFHALPSPLFSEAVDTNSAALVNMCEHEFEVLAGVVFFRKSLLYSQFLPDITSSLSLIAMQEEPLGIDVPVMHKLPPGVKLKKVYLTQDEIKYLQKRRCQRFIKDRRKQFQALQFNGSSEADIDSDSYNHGFNSRLGFDETSQFSHFRLSTYGYEVPCVSSIHPIHLPCYHHAHKIRGKMTSTNEGYYPIFKESCDLEFQCYICTKGPKCLILSRPYSLSKVKRWNSEMDIMCFYQQQCIASMFLSPIYSSNCKKNLQKAQRRRSALKYHRSKHSSFSSQDKDSSKKIEPRKRSCSLWNEFFYSPFQCISFSKQTNDQLYNPSWNNDELHHSCVLYVQKCGECTLILLLDSIPTDHLLFYLWHCGFLVLPNIGYETRHQSTSKPHIINTDFNIHTFKYKSQLLYGKLSATGSSDHVKSLIHKDFYSDPLLYSLSIVEPSRSICAYNTKDKQIFYEQMGLTHHKVHWFAQFWEKACRRTEKYLHISLPKNLV